MSEGRMVSVRVVACVAMCAALAACQSSADKPTGLGTRVVSSNVRELAVVPGGAAVVTLSEVAPSKERGAPADVFVGALTLVNASGGAPRTLGGGVTNLPGAWNFSPDGKAIAFLAQYSVARARGELRLAKVAGGEPESLGDAVTFHAFSPDGATLAWVNGGDLWLRAVDQPGEGERVESEVAQFEFGPKGTPAAGLLLVKKTIPAKRELKLFSLEKRTSRSLASGVGGYGFSPSGDRFVFHAESLETASAFAKAAKADTSGFYVSPLEGAPTRLSTTGAIDFRFSPDGKRLAWTAPSKAGDPAGDVWIDDGAGEPVKVASRVAQFFFGADGTLAVLAGSNSSMLATLALLPPTVKGLATEVTRNVRHAAFTQSGSHLVLTQATVGNSSYSTELLVHRVGAPADEKPVKIDVAPGGFEVDEAAARIVYKSKCMDEGRACTLLWAPLGGGEAKQLLTRVAAFERTDGTLVATVTSRRANKTSAKLAFALGVVDLSAASPTMRVLENDMTGEFAVFGAGRKTLAYLVDDPKKAGLYLVDRDATPKD